MWIYPVGGRDEKGIISWLKKKSGPPAVTLASKEDAEKLLKEQVTVVGFFKVNAEPWV